MAVRRISIGTVLLLAAAIPASSTTEEFVGQIVCSQCWHEADRRIVPYGSEGDIACAARCAAQGVPSALAIRDGTSFRLVRLEGDGPGWLESVAKFARVTGELREVNGDSVLRVATAVILEHDPWIDEPPSRDAPSIAALEWTDMLGRPVMLEHYQGRILVLNFWATWCAPCREEMPDLSRIQRDFAVYGVQVVGAAADAPEAREGVLDFARASRVRFPVLLGSTTEQMQALGLGVALPATVVIDADGQIVHRVNGRIDRRTLAAVVQRLVDGAAPAHDHDSTIGARTGHTHDHGLTHASLVPS